MTQKEKIKTYLESRRTNGNVRTLTQPEATSRFGVTNLRARISELRKDGINIGTTSYTRKDGVTAVKYYIEQPKPRKVAVKKN